MKKRKFVIIYPLLCSSVLMTALLGPLAAPVSVYAASAASEAAAEEAADVEQGSVSGNSQVSQAVLPPELILSKCYLLESDNYESIADGYFQAALLSEESANK